jgi:hypothetical protein
MLSSVIGNQITYYTHPRGPCLAFILTLFGLVYFSNSSIAIAATPVLERMRV